MPKQRPRKTRTIGFDPGINNTWYAVWEGRRLIDCGHFPTPSTIVGVLSEEFRTHVRVLFDKYHIGSADDVVIERYSHRGKGGKGNVAEVMHGIIDVLAMVALDCKANVFLILASVHKVSYSVHHPQKYPRALIEKRARLHGQWRPNLKRVDPNEHCRDALTIGCHRILRREGSI